MKQIFAALFAVVLLAPVSASAVGVNYTAIVTSLDLSGPAVLNSEFAVDDVISGQFIYDDVTGEITRLSVTNGTSTWGYFDGGTNVNVAESSVIAQNHFFGGYGQGDPPGSGPSINGHDLATFIMFYDEHQNPLFNNGRDPILDPPTLPNQAQLLAMGADTPNDINLYGMFGAIDWRDLDHPNGINGSIARLRFDVTGVTAIQAVPLPAPLFLLVAGLAAIGFVGRRKAQA